MFSCTEISTWSPLLCVESPLGHPHEPPVTQPYFFTCLIIILLKTDILHIIMWEVWKSDSPPSAVFIAVCSCLCLFSGFSELISESLYSLLFWHLKLSQWSASESSQTSLEAWTPPPPPQNLPVCRWALYLAWGMPSTLSQAAHNSALALTSFLCRAE